MRLHFRRLVLIGCLALVCIFLFLYVYGRSVHTYKSARSAHESHEIWHMLHVADVTPQPDAIYWDKYSGIRPNKLGAKDREKNKENILSDRIQHGSFDMKVTNLSIGAPSEEEIDKELTEAYSKNYNLNTQKSDQIPLNRDVPDSRPDGCSSIVYPSNLPTTSVVIPFHNEWPSVIVRTVYSLINHTPKELLKEIILVDDASDVSLLKSRLQNYIDWNFPKGLVKLIRLRNREGLIRARLEGLRHVTGEVVSFFDSHMEVNKNWLQPLLNEIVKNRSTIAMGQLDYIHHETFDYNFYPGYRTRYGFRWDMQFFETYFRPDQVAGKKDTDPLPGVLMVGPGFAVDVNYFKHIGTYDGDMMIWGGENIELAWRVWMCGGQLLHVPCSRIGHVERFQPYKFPKGRRLTESYNYKRAVDVWMGHYKEYVYNRFPGMKDLDSGSLSQRNVIRARLKCHSFSWFIKHIWPELLPYKEKAQYWGQIKTFRGNGCLDNDDYVFQKAQPLILKSCVNNLQTQGFTLTKEKRLRTTIHCVVAKAEGADLKPYMENCFINAKHLWDYNKNQQLVHRISKLCLQVMKQGALVLQPCKDDMETQKWIFQNKGLLT